MKILTQDQAKAVYDAMRALKGVGGVISATIGPISQRITVEEFAASGHIFVTGIGVRDQHPNQAAFAAAYGLGA